MRERGNTTLSLLLQQQELQKDCLIAQKYILFPGLVCCEYTVAMCSAPVLDFCTFKTNSRSKPVQLHRVHAVGGGQGSYSGSDCQS